MVKLVISKKLLFPFIFALVSPFLIGFILSNPGATITVSTPANGTTYEREPGINISTNINTTFCDYLINQTTPIALGNGTWTNTSWGNSSELAWTQTGYNRWANITYRCNLTDWYNTTNTTGYILFKLDRTNPVVNFQRYNYTVLNSSTWTFTFNFTDNNYNNCGLRFYQDKSLTTPVVFTGSLSNASEGEYSIGNCTLPFDPETVPSSYMDNGQFKLEGFGNDTLNHLTYTNTNVTGVATKIYANKWNMINYLGSNGTLNTETVYNFIKNHFSYATYISIWNNTYGNFTTYSTSTPSINNASLVYPGLAIYVYSTSTKWFIEPDWTTTVGTAAENITLTLNGTNKLTTSWNQMGLFYNVTVNTTLYACSNDPGFGTTIRAGKCGAGQLNVTYVSWFNASGNSYVTCKRGFSICSGGANPGQVILPKGSAIWILPNIAITLNRSAII